MSLGDLSQNLHEMYAYLKSDPTTNPHLVASNQNSLYLSTMGFGRFWSFFKSSDARLQSAVQHTDTLFKKYFAEALTASIEYQKHLKNCWEGKISPNSSYIHWQKILTRWLESTAPMAKLIDKRDPEAIALIQKIFATQLNEDTQASLPFSYGKYSKELTLIKRVIKLEGRLQEQLPITALFKLAQKQKLSKWEKKHVKSMVKIIDNQDFNTNQEHLVTVGNFHKAIKGLIALAFPKSPKKLIVKLLARLESSLIEMKSQLFFQKDPKQIAWRQAQNRKGKFGKCYSQKSNAVGVSEFFFTHPTSACIISIPSNRAILHIRKLTEKEKGWGVISAKFKVQKNGRFATIEKFSDPISTYQWKSDHKNLDSEDLKVVKPIIRFLKWQLEQEKTADVSVEDLVLNHEWQLRSTKIILQTPSFDFNRMVKFSFDICSGNRKIYSFILQESGLAKHRYSMFYKKIVERSSKGLRTTHVADSFDIYDDKIRKQGETLAQEISRLKGLYEIKMELDNRRKSLERKENSLMACYRHYALAGFLPPFFEKEMFHF